MLSGSVAVCRASSLCLACSILQLEDQQSNRAGWLFAKGAFDKGDLLHVRDEEEKRRHREQELLNADRNEFLRQRAALEMAAAEPRETKGDPAGGATTSSGAPPRPRVPPNSAHHQPLPTERYTWCAQGALVTVLC